MRCATSTSAREPDACAISRRAMTLLRVSREIERCTKADEFGLIGLTVAVTSGGQWPRARLREAGYAIAAECPAMRGGCRDIMSSDMELSKELWSQGLR